MSIEAGHFIVVSGWRGPVMRVEKVTAKTVTAVEINGYGRPHRVGLNEVLATFESEEAARAAYARYTKILHAKDAAVEADQMIRAAAGLRIQARQAEIKTAALAALTEGAVK